MFNTNAFNEALVRLETTADNMQHVVDLLEEVRDLLVEQTELLRVRD